MTAATSPLSAVTAPIRAYTHWLHTRWPAGKPEVLPVVNQDGSTNVTGLYVVGDLSGIPLLKLSVNAGVNVIKLLAEQLKSETPQEDTLDVAIIGGGTAGFAAAKQAEAMGLRYMVFEASEPFATITNFPKGKPIYKYPTELPLEGGIEFHDKSDFKEGLIEDLREQTVDQGLKYVVGRVSHVERKGGGFDVVLPDGATAGDGVDLDDTGFTAGKDRVRAKRVIVAIGRSGNYRKLGVPGEDKDHKVFNRLHDPKDYCGQNVLIVGGGDSAMEGAIALAKCGANVTLSYRKAEFNRPKPENREMILALAENPDAEANVESASDVRQAASMPEIPEDGPKGSLKLELSSNVGEIRDNEVDLKLQGGSTQTIPNDSVFAMIGREPPLDFFRRSGVKILGERTFTWWWTLIAFFAFCFWLYHWKGEKSLFGVEGWKLPAWLSPDTRAWMPSLQQTLGGWASDPANPIGVLLNSARGPSFYYTLAYSIIIVVFGIRRVKRRKTPYVKWQTLTLALVQVIPLFLLPEFILPWLNGLGFFDNTGVGRWLEKTLFPGKSWWRAYGLILAWPLFIYNWFESQPIWGWLVLGSIQTFVLIPGMIYFWGKGAYCGWICSCGALAETLGDQHRHKMPHGPIWNRLNMIGQVILLFAVILLILRIVGWVLGPDSWASIAFDNGSSKVGVLNYKWSVDILLAGIVGYGFYFWYSGRVWCRFMCPLAALMHIYARFSRFGILAEKKKCISCNVCTSVCHQGIDIMSFANKGEAMRDPECVRCSACVQMCPTGVLSFGQVDKKTGKPIGVDPSWLAASPVLIREGQITVDGKPIAQR